MAESVISYFATWTEGLVGQSHLFSATAALTAGAMVLRLRKGTRVHVAAGYAYLFAMLSVNGTALAKYDLTGGPNLFHGAAIASLLTLAGAFAAAMRYRVIKRRSAAAAHGVFMIWSYFGLFAALIAEIVTRRFPYMLHGEGGWTRFTIALVLFMAIAGIFTHRYAQREVRRTLPR